MCLAIPGQILSIGSETDPMFRTGRVSFGGMIKQINLACVPEAICGDFVIVHVGVAIARLDEAEARRVFEYLTQIDELKELQD